MDEPIRLYEGDAPGSEGWSDRERRYFSELWTTEVVTNVVVPTLVPVRPTAPPNGKAVIVAPGGAFHALSIDSEGFGVAERLAADGITTFVLKYRLVRGGDDPVAELNDKMVTGDVSFLDDMATAAALAGGDGEAAVRAVRERADEFGVDPDRVGFMGFSAGGNVALRAVYSRDAASRPNWIAPIYALNLGVDLDDLPDDSGSPFLVPMFLVVATDDTLGLATDSVALYQRWRLARLPVELHAYARGGHGFGVRTQDLPSDTWIDRFLDWLPTAT